MNTFNSFKLQDKLLQAVTELGFSNPTPVQEKAIPLLLSHKGDFVAQAQTGTGKTAAFALPLLQGLSPKAKGVQAVILAPTRELAQQVFEQVSALAKFVEFKSSVIYGGVSYQKQLNDLRKNKPAIIIGTPGRVIDLLERGALDFSSAKRLVVDEADEMLNMGFLDDVEQIIEELPKKHQIWLFSATVPAPIKELIQEKFNKVESLKVTKKNLSNENIDQYYLVIAKKHYVEALKRIVTTEKNPYGIIFCETKVETKQIAEALENAGLSVAPLHGDLSQAQRDYAMGRFREKRIEFLVCTDVAARGIDVKNIGHVFNFGLPRNPDAYIHRIGRTGRAGTTGTAISFIPPAQRSYVKKIENMSNAKIRPMKLPKISVIKERKVQNELERITPLKESILSKGDEFVIDESFGLFQDFMKDMSKEDALKLLFSLKFNTDFQRLNQLGELILEPKRDERNDRGRGKKKRSFSRARRPRKPGRPRTQR